MAVRSAIVKFDYNDLINKKIIIEELEVQSFEMNLYLVKLTVDGNAGMLYHNQALMRFNSSQQIRDAFESIHVVKAVMVHESPYDEMIGNPPKASQSMSLPFSMTQPYWYTAKLFYYFLKVNF